MTTLTQMTSTQLSKYATFNNALSAVSPAAMFGRRPEAITGLTWAYYGGILWANGAWRTVADNTIALTASQTNYIEVSIEGSGTVPTISANTSAFTAGRWPLAEITTDGSSITGEIDRRLAIAANPQGYDIQSIAAAASHTPDALAGEVVVIGALTQATTINAPTNPFTAARLTFLFTQDATGSWGLTWNAAFKKSADPTAGTSNQQGTISFIYDGANWVQTGGALIWF